MSDCLIWPGRKNPQGYGLWYAGKRLYGTQYAHRAVWITQHGPVPKGYEVDHICFNPGCILLEHLQLLTVRENRQRRQTWKMHKDACPQGHPYTAENIYVGRRPDGRTYWKCRACLRTRSGEWMAANHERRLEYFREYRRRLKEARRAS